MRRSTIFLFTLLLLSATAVAQVPGQMSYQGTLTDAGGVVLDTTVSVTFTIYDDSTSGATLWTETQPGVAVTDGLFHILLGSVNSIPDSVFQDPDRWLGIQIGADPELEPRQLIAAVGYAFRAAESDTADYARGVPGGSDGDWTISGNHLYSAVPGSVGIGTTTPEAKLDILGTVNVGEYGSPGYDVNLLGTSIGSKLFWDADKQALRAGKDSDGTYWHPDSVGDYSTALGLNTKASGAGAVATGYQTTASGYYSAAMGYSSTASGPYATAMGHNTIASGDWSTATGIYTTASGDASTVMGHGSVASGYTSTAMGYGSTASGYRSTAIGCHVTADTTDAIVLGSGIDPGDNLVNNIENSLMVGFDDTTATLFVGGPDKRVGIGTQTPAAKLHLDGTFAVGEDASGYDVNFYGAWSGGRLFWDEDEMAFRAGRDLDGTHWAPDSVGRFSVATGINSKAKGFSSIAVGTDVTAAGDYSVAMGYNANAGGLSSTAIGLGVDANTDNATAFGYGTTASGLYTTALGHGTEASGTDATAMGYNTGASGDASTAMGWGSSAGGTASLAAGYFSTTDGHYSTAIGYESEAWGHECITIGRFVNADTDSCMVIGSGIDDSNRLANNTPNSLIMGFNTTTPTLFVGGPDHRVGIGTSSPSEKLHVNGNTHVNNALTVDGNVGIGTTSPSSQLHVEGVIEVDQKIQANDSGGLELATDEGTTRLFIDDTGNVGIGLTTPNRSLYIAENVDSLAYPLKIDNYNGNWNVAAGLLFSAGGNGTPSGILDTARGKGALVYEYTASWNRGKFHFLQNTATDTTNPELADAVMTIANDGKVGIGTTIPGYKLDVNGDINVRGSYNIKKAGTNYTHPDYVFEPDYELMPLDELREHVFAEKSLPNVISADDVRKNDGFKMDELLVQMLEKIEEQTLYVFQLEERIAALEEKR